MSTHLPRTVWDTLTAEDPDPSLPKYDDLTEYEQRIFDHSILSNAGWSVANVVRHHRRDNPVV